MNRGLCGSPTCSCRNKSPVPLDVPIPTSGLHVALRPTSRGGPPDSTHWLSGDLTWPPSVFSNCTMPRRRTSVGHTVVALESRRGSDCVPDLNTVSKTDSSLLDTKTSKNCKLDYDDVPWEQIEQFKWELKWARVQSSLTPQVIVSACMQWMRSRGGEPSGGGGGERCTWSGHRRRRRRSVTLPRFLEMLRVADVGDDMDAL
ncbi:hypothetical protein BHE74_00037889 [Ensete ventricosum]|nr:hypothetical protein GW17_00050604 [Ensete ventricosum]RWW55477.1 hypothetical protein BHE74_00037889 [Ensete ventricosum]RZS21863.1 hypothetical protein BHM03_00054557 [Ensete ventricosum]